MNKFVKGAKNLAFALSFVTIAACGGVKKADLEALEKKINDKFDGVAKDGKADSSQGYVRKGDIQGFVKGDVVTKQINDEVNKVKKEVVNLDVLDKAFVKNPAKFVEFFGSGVELSEEVLKGSKIVLSGFAANGKCCFEVENEGKKIIKKGDAAALTEGDLEVLKACVANGTEVVWGSEMCFIAGDGTSGVTFKDNMVFNLEDATELNSLVILLEIGLLAKKTFGDLKLSLWKVTADGVSGKKIKTGSKEVNRRLVDVLNRYEKDCCSFEESVGQVTFVGNKGWTSNGSEVIKDDVKVAVK